ncbi:predicted protein [Histoplasma capsulatum G186AR]|uniref:Uncharacterized protein n=1 Tax=Ajellomyces capsulatus (strain G186AR / H82 / ATCC MYA-2454 / RMSCC 2432) TaxID=447093 RepID=C0NTW8_AJECG|nr:uncharacterized protein HCBG_06598 [Histoplasma capsulatum G186AR]EEH05479.1 predicted protein [Histoplasma capsulatum G186AR]
MQNLLQVADPITLKLAIVGTCRSIHAFWKGVIGCFKGFLYPVSLTMVHPVLKFGVQLHVAGEKIPDIFGGLSRLTMLSLLLCPELDMHFERLIFRLAVTQLFRSAAGDAYHSCPSPPPSTWGWPVGTLNRLGRIHPHCALDVGPWKVQAAAVISVLIQVKYGHTAALAPAPHQWLRNENPNRIVGLNEETDTQQTSARQMVEWERKILLIIKKQ